MATLTEAERSNTIAEWQHAVEALFDQIESWTGKYVGWKTGRTTKEVTEQELGTYRIQSMVVHTPDGRLDLEPVARIVFGGRGTVELRSWPTLFRVRLLRGKRDEEWDVITDSNVRLRQEWNEETFHNLKNDLLGVM